MMKWTGFFVVFLLLSGCAQAASRIKDIDLSDDRIRETDTFTIEISIRNPDSGMVVDFYIDNEYINSVNVGSSRDEYESNKIDLREDPLSCGTHTAKAVLKQRSTDDHVSQLSLDFNVGNLPKIEITPEKPLVDKDSVIKLSDPDTGSPLVDVKVEIYNRKDERTTKGHTNIQGEYTYMPSKYGRYEITIDDTKYCGRVYLDAKNSLRVDGPHPENPVVGEKIHIAVPIGVGVKVIDTEGDVYLTAFTTIGGGANFSINDSGNYTIVIGEYSSRYWGINRSITVSGRPVPAITFSPENAVVGKSVSIAVESRDASLADASVTISGPDKSFDTFYTPTNGVIAFTPMAVGDYTVRAEKPRYDSVSKTLPVKNELYVDIEPDVPAVGGSITVIVRNQLGNVVAGVSIQLDEVEMGVTDAAGRYTLALREPKNYTITVSKKDVRYWDAVKHVKPAAELKIELSETEIRVGESTAVTVYDKLGAEVSAALSVKDPEGKTTPLDDGVFTADSHGVYTIIAFKQGYGTTMADVTVKPQAINVGWSTRGKNLILTISSGGKTIPGIAVTIIEPIEGTLATTAEGEVSLPIKAGGRYKIEVNKANNNPDYETKTESRVVAKNHRLGILFLLILIILALTAAALLVVHKKVGRGGGGAVQTKLHEKKPDKPSKLGKKSLRKL